MVLIQRVVIQVARRGICTPLPFGAMPVILALFSLVLTFAPAVALAEPPPAETGIIDADIFGHNAKWFHGFLGVSEAYDDNIYNTAEDPQSDSITIITPGIQFMVPAADQRAEDLVTNAATPGGLMLGRFDEPYFRRFRAYIGYTPAFHYYDLHPEENLVDHAAQGGVQYNLRSGYAIDIVNRYAQDYQRTEANISPSEDRYDTNIFNVIATLPLTERFHLKAEYSNYWISYNREETATNLNRTDHSITGRLYYQFLPKTAAFAAYRLIRIEYEDNKDRNNDTTDIGAGINWNVTAKTRGTIQAGYSVRHYENAEDENNLNENTEEDLTGYVFQANIHYQFSSKTSLGLRGYHRDEESYYFNYDYTRTTAVGLDFSQALTHRIALNLTGWYYWEDYEVRADTISMPDRTDQTADIDISLVYAFRQWMSASLGYQHRSTDSNLDQESFSGNTAMLTITGSI